MRATSPRRAIRPGLVALLAALLVTGCGAGPPEHVRIGLLAPLTGTRSWLGQDLLAGAQFAVDDLNDAGGLLGRPVELVVVDDSDLTAMPGQLADLAERAHVSAVVGPESPGVLLGPRSPLSRRGVPAVLASAFGGELDDAGTYVARTVPSAEAQATRLGTWLVEERGIDTASVLVADSLEGALAQPDLEAGLRAGGVTVSAVAQADGDAADLRPAVASLRDRAPDVGAVLLWATPAAAARATTAVRDLGWDVQLAVPATAFASEYRTLAAEATEGVVLTFPFDWGWFSSDLVPWMVRYQTRVGFGLLPQLDTLVIDIPVAAVAAYDAVGVIGAAVTQAGTREPRDVAEALADGAHDGLLSTYRFDDEHEAWADDGLYVARFHELALIFDVDPRLDLDQQMRFWRAQVSLDLFDDNTPPAVQAIIDRFLSDTDLEPPPFRDPLPPPGPVGRP